MRYGWANGLLPLTPAHFGLITSMTASRQGLMLASGLSAPSHTWLSLLVSTWIDRLTCKVHTVQTSSMSPDTACALSTRPNSRSMSSLRSASASWMHTTALLTLTSCGLSVTSLSLAGATWRPMTTVGSTRILLLPLMTTSLSKTEKQIRHFEVVKNQVSQSI